MGFLAFLWFLLLSSTICDTSWRQQRRKNAATSIFGEDSLIPAEVAADPVGNYEKLMSRKTAGLILWFVAGHIQEEIWPEIQCTMPPKLISFIAVILSTVFLVRTYKRLMDRDYLFLLGAPSLLSELGVLLWQLEAWIFLGLIMLFPRSLFSCWACYGVFNFLWLVFWSLFHDRFRLYYKAGLQIASSQY